MLICQITTEHRKWFCPLVRVSSFLFACFIVILCMMHANKVFTFKKKHLILRVATTSTQNNANNHHNLNV